MPGVLSGRGKKIATLLLDVWYSRSALVLTRLGARSNHLNYTVLFLGPETLLLESSERP